MKNKPQTTDRFNVVYVGAKDKTVLMQALAHFGVLIDAGDGTFRPGEGIELIQPYQCLTKEGVYEDGAVDEENGVISQVEISKPVVSKNWTVTIGINLDYILRFKDKGEELTTTPDDAMQYFVTKGAKITRDGTAALGLKFPPNVTSPNLWLFTAKPKGAYEIAGLGNLNAQ